VAATRWGQIEGIDLGGGAPIPRLDQVLIAIGDRATVYVELKGKHIEESVIPVVRNHGHRFALHSFDHDAIARLATSAPDLARGILFDDNTSNPVAALRAGVAHLVPRDVWPHWSLVDRHFVDVAHELGVRVITWTVN